MDSQQYNDGFEYQASASRILFGSGTINKIGDELRRINSSNPLILCTPQQVSQAEDVKTILHGKVAGIFAEATMHTPVDVTERAISTARFTKCDSVVSIGGGSTIGLGKAICFRTGLYHIALPTTYAGSEVTSILGETQNGRKTTQTNRMIFPGTVIYDVDLTLSLPVELSITSGVNAISHAVEALYSQTRNPITDLLAREGVAALAEALPVLRANDPATLKTARTKALYGSWLCGTCLGSVGMALHHKLCHTLGGTFGLPHAETHTIVLPHALAYNAPKVPEAMATLAAVLPGSEGDAVRGLNVLLNRLGVKRDLKSYGFREEDIPKAVDIALSNPYWNPRPLERKALEGLMRRAWAGEDAKADL
ncbi:putative maleylacetate reductase [Plectosphaerella plurivora]|uniref:Maleylacetate reductase n=1 Tax=Plectosphaerella plurivora TaxID=936078 RepID=A0A9P8V9T6_9PEZI|nr:putative maleylacetate reductase [Plectosphaerella plurivora]